MLKHGRKEPTVVGSDGIFRISRVFDQVSKTGHMTTKNFG